MVKVELRDDRYHFTPPTHAGRVVFDITNQDRVAHGLVLVMVPPDRPALTYRADAPHRDVLPTLSTIPPLPPDASNRFAVDLTPGHYAIVSFVRDPDGVQQVFKGMHSEFTVG